MDILYFQTIRAFSWGGETIMDILFFQGVGPFRLGGKLSGHSLLPRGTTL